jgi:CheY-like chemotaxis protein
MAKILIIDDDPDIVEAMKIVLESRKHEVVIAENGENGLKKLKTNKPDIIILDVMMETGDKGFEVARIIKKEAPYKNIPILMLTAIKEKTGLDFRREAGDENWLPVDGYMDKPLKPEELIRKVETLIGRR